MKFRRWPLLSLIGFLIVAGGVFVSTEVTVLQLENLDRQKILRIKVSPAESLSLSYLHSIYREPVVEEFRLREGEFLLTGVITRSPGVMEYYGFEEVRDRHPVERRWAFLDLKRTPGGEQVLIVKGRQIELRDLGEEGDRIRLRVLSLRLGPYLLGSIDQLLSPPFLGQERE
ncbi:MAG: DUF1850 domain-containing protein [Desulfobacterota bacterium]|nr:DUF1850 domain-containing protein [Thermodesulfobacteriota bacterium]